MAKSKISNTNRKTDLLKDIDFDKSVDVRNLHDLAADQALKIKALTNEIVEYKKEIDDLNTRIEGIKFTKDKMIQHEKLTALGRFTADVAHEIRNPLTALGGYARRLSKKAAGGTKEKEYIDVIISEVGRLEHILSDVLTFARDARFHAERYNINEVVKESLKTYKDLCEEQSVEMHMSFKKIPEILIDRDQVRQALDNIISNAIDSMPDGGTLKVETCMEMMHEIGYVTVKIIDCGEGIPEDKLGLLFEPFFTTKKIGHGTGLGLSISRKIMEEHHGLIKAESTVGKGTVFTMYFPYQSEEDDSKIKCWQYLKCGKDCATEGTCSSYPNYGRICWVVAGTFCQGKVQGTYAQKIDNCKRCPFYNKVVDKEL